ncbi:MAG: NPCBM/NEW2 domain-containing protein [Pirellulaceae bacterium]|nr:NPCBM/NEW2 domain-containing protein [Pirellulaceae bacterium]
MKSILPRLTLSSFLLLATFQPAWSATFNLDGRDWLLATDSENIGREQHWYNRVEPGAKSTRVPGILQETYPGYHGVVWYWREFLTPANPYNGGRYLLRFWQVDYLADVWVNGVHIGQHEGTGDPFVLDATEVVKPGQKNLVAVRVLNPTVEPIDGYVLQQTTAWARGVPCKPGLALNYGGITESVELIVSPSVRIEDLFVKPDIETGKIRIQANVRNASQRETAVRIEFSVAPDVRGETLHRTRVRRVLKVGDSQIDTVLLVHEPRLWELNDPFLYRVTARIEIDDSTEVAEQSTRCGFRDFRFEDGYFRLNGKRIFIKCAQTDARAPVGHFVPLDPELVRRDLINCKATNHNMIRTFGGQVPRSQIDMCDEIGLLVYQEHAGAWRMAPSPKLAERFDRSVKSMIRRDRNHPSVVIWGILNETVKDPIYEHALTTLPLVRELDDSRVVLLNSGDFAHTGKVIADPELQEWESTLFDTHPYKSVPHRADVIHSLRTHDKNGLPIFHSEGGIGSAIDLVRNARHYERLEATECEDALVCREMLDKFLADWERWNLADTFANPDDYFHQCLAWMADLRVLATNALRSNPNLVAYNVTGLVDPSTTGEGMLATTFRELKPGIVDAMFDAFAPLRWCLFVEPVQVYRGRAARFEAVLANEDILGAGEYPVRLQVVGPENVSVFDRTMTINVPETSGRPEPSFALPVFAEDIVVEGPSGKYRFLVTFLEGAAAEGGELEFYVADPEEMPAVEEEIVIWGGDVELAKWCTDVGIKNRKFQPGKPESREVILVGLRPEEVFMKKSDYWEGAERQKEAESLPQSEPGLIPLQVFDRIQRDGHEGKPLNLNGKLYERGIFTHARSRIVVQLPSPGKSFVSTAGIISDSFAAGGQGSVIYSVSLKDKNLFRSDVRREGMPPLSIDVDLQGETLFLLEVSETTDGIAADQACWADAKVTLQDGTELWLSEMKEVPPSDAFRYAFSSVVYQNAIRELAKRIAYGSHVVFLSPDVFHEGNLRTRYLPLTNKGVRADLHIWLYHKDDWAKNHPIFDGMPTGCVLDHDYYREVIDNSAWSGQSDLAEVVAGSIHASLGYSSGLSIAIHNLGAGQFTLNTMRIRQNLGKDPVAERLLRNMLNYAARETDQPVTELPTNFDEQLDEMGL